MPNPLPSNGVRSDENNEFSLAKPSPCGSCTGAKNAQMVSQCITVVQVQNSECPASILSRISLACSGRILFRTFKMGKRPVNMLEGLQISPRQDRVQLETGLLFGYAYERHCVVWVYGVLKTMQESSTSD